MLPTLTKKKKRKQYQTGIVKTTKFPRKMGISGRSPERPGGAVVKNPPAKEGHARGGDSIPGSGRSPGGGNGNPLQYSCLENPMDREPVGRSPSIRKESDMIEYISTHPYLRIYLTVHMRSLNNEHSSKFSQIPTTARVYTKSKHNLAVITDICICI